MTDKWRDRVMSAVIIMAVLWFIFELVRDPSGFWKTFYDGWVALANGG